MFSETFEKQFNKLTGRKLDISYLSSVFLSIGMTVATLAMSGNLDEAMLLLITFANGVDRKSDANFTSFVGILSVPDAFLLLTDFRIKFTMLEVNGLSDAKVLLELKWLFTDISFLILIMLEWFSYFLIMLCNTIPLSKTLAWKTIFSGFKPLDRSKMLIYTFLIEQLQTAPSKIQTLRKIP